MSNIENIKRRAENNAKASGMYLCPDPDFLQNLLEGLKDNEERYGYGSCPCRLASGNFEWDRDIICPCDYRDPDVEEYGQCFCALYVSKDVHEGTKPMESIPERRPQTKIDRALGKPPEEPVTQRNSVETSDTNRKLFYCKVCGYVTFREEAPHKCPICQAKQEMFGEIVLGTSIQVR
ncbi:MAG: ferredoxin-thioredoxin reductase catalytic domain-containing protein [Promethearchaeota archaeon]